MADKRPDRDAGLFRRIDLNLFRVFLEIARAGGIGAAARRLNLRQPAVSLALQRLEGHLGHALCSRTSRGVTLTPAGRVAAHYAEQLFREVEALPRALAAAAGEVEGDLVIRAVSGVVSPEIDATLETMARRHPRIRLLIDIAPRRMVLQALAKGMADACITFDAAPRADLHYEVLMREYQQIYCGRAHPLYGLRIGDPAVLAGERFILMGSDEPDDVRNFRRRYGLGENPAGIAENLPETIRLIRLGIGIGFLPTLIAEGVTPADTLWPLLPAEMLPNYLMYLVTRPADEQSLPAQLFLAEIRRRLAAQAP